MIPAFDCIITGADLWDIPRNRWIHGDLFEGKDVWVFNGVLSPAGGPHWNYTGEGLHHDRALYVSDPDYFERRAVIVVPKWAGELTAGAKAYVEESRR